MTPIESRRAAFRELHREGCFVIPNPWDVGSARLLAGLGFRALATTSAGFAWSLGISDTQVTLDQALAHYQTIVQSVDLPVNADFEGGYAVEPADVAANVARACATGIAGVSIEDRSEDANPTLFDFNLSVERVRAARHAIDETGSGVLLTGRCEAFRVGQPDLGETIRRLVAYAEAGAECLYAPFLRTREDISAVVKAVAPKAVNILVGVDFTTVAELADLGVRRISVGGTLSRAAWTAFLGAAREIAENGTFTAFGRIISFAELDGMFRGDGRA